MDKAAFAGVRPAFLKPLELHRHRTGCVICKQPILQGDSYYEAKGELFHEECVPSELIPVMGLLGFQPQQKGA